MLTPAHVDAAVVRSLDNLNALGQVLNCIDPDRWNSLARPSAAGLAGLILTLAGDVQDAVEGAVSLPEIPPA